AATAAAAPAAADPAMAAAGRRTVKKAAVATVKAAGFLVRPRRLAERAEDTEATRPTGAMTAAAPIGEVAAPAPRAAAHTSPPIVVGSSRAGFDGDGFFVVRLAADDFSTGARRDRAD
ncbi:MAG TPA: hypothetical protein VFV02_00325, partial [Acidimicrobiales bacterium]|nr:hypothetical protein [Acidimicrobiales bacterium]